MGGGIRTSPASGRPHDHQRRPQRRAARRSPEQDPRDLQPAFHPRRPGHRRRRTRAPTRTSGCIRAPSPLATAATCSSPGRRPPTPGSSTPPASPGRATRTCRATGSTATPCDCPAARPAPTPSPSSAATTPTRPLDGSSFHPATDTTETTNADVKAPSWTPGASWNVARANSNTVLLPDGSMVTVGGGSGYDDSNNGGGYVTYADGRARQVELYDPQTNSWTLGPAQQEDRAYHSTAVLLPDGRVFSGGDDLHPLEPNGIDSQTDNGGDLLAALPVQGHAADDRLGPAGDPVGRCLRDPHHEPEHRQGGADGAGRDDARLRHEPALRRPQGPRHDRRPRGGRGGAAVGQRRAARLLHALPHQRGRRAVGRRAG